MPYHWNNAVIYIIQLREGNLFFLNAIHDFWIIVKRIIEKMLNLTAWL